MESLQHSLSKAFGGDNQVFAGGFGLAVLAAGAQGIRKCGAIGIQLLKRHFLITLEVTSKDRSFPWVLNWLAAQGKRTQHLSVETSRMPTTTTSTSSSSSSVTSRLFSLVPGPGQHFLHYKGKFISVQRFREMTVDLNTGKPWEKVQLMAFGTDPSCLEAILQESFEMATAQEEGKIIIYTNWGSEWRPFGNPRNRRPLESVILDVGISEKLYKDVCEWQQSASWYADRGIPYRRGYLLHGPPGSGKSSFIMALAGKLRYNICILNLAERGLTDDRLALALSCVPPQSLILLEDIDAAFPSSPKSRNAQIGSTTLRNNRNLNTGSDVTFSGLLNVLDGVASSEERIVFMTTNFIEHLDSALIRPGRVDMVQYIGDASYTQAREMFLKFYPTYDELADEFADTMIHSGMPVSMATLQGYFLRYKDCPKDAVKCIESFIDEELKPQVNIPFLNSEDFTADIISTPNVSSSATDLTSNVSSSNSVQSPLSFSIPSDAPKKADEFQEFLRKQHEAQTHGIAQKYDTLEEEEAAEFERLRIEKAKRGPLTVDEVDKMVFNPQADWDKGLQGIDWQDESFFTGTKK